VIEPLPDLLGAVAPGLETLGRIPIAPDPSPRSIRHEDRRLRQSLHAPEGTRGVLIVGLEEDLLADLDVRLLGDPGARDDLFGLRCDVHPPVVPAEEEGAETEMIPEHDDPGALGDHAPEHAPKVPRQSDPERPIGRDQDVGRVLGAGCMTGMRGLTREVRDVVDHARQDDGDVTVQAEMGILAVFGHRHREGCGTVPDHLDPTASMGSSPDHLLDDCPVGASAGRHGYRDRSHPQPGSLGETLGRRSFETGGPEPAKGRPHLSVRPSHLSVGQNANPKRLR
jgi:hypothetical protein